MSKRYLCCIKKLLCIYANIVNKTKKNIHPIDGSQTFRHAHPRQHADTLTMNTYVSIIKKFHISLTFGFENINALFEKTFFLFKNIVSGSNEWHLVLPLRDFEYYNASANNENNIEN